MIKAVFLQHLFNFSDPELEDQLIDPLSFQKFVGIQMDQSRHFWTAFTFWRFKEALVEEILDQHIFEQVTGQLVAHGMIVNKGTIVDVAIMALSNRPLSGDRNPLGRKILPLKIKSRILQSFLLPKLVSFHKKYRCLSCSKKKSSK